MIDQQRIHYLGLFRSPASWAKVNREIVRTLDQTDLTVSATPFRGLHFHPDFDLSDSFETMFQRSRDADLEIAMEYPPNLWKMKGKINIPWILYETALPDHWAKSLRDHGDYFLSPSRYTAQRAIESGIPASKIHIVPFGVNFSFFQRVIGEDSQEIDSLPNTRNKLTLLFVGSQHRRKGLRETLEAYHRAFSIDDPIQLVVKTLPHASKSKEYPWEIQGEKLLKDFQKQAKSPKVTWIEDVLSTKQMVHLYEQVDLLVVPSYAESFGLIFLESMATGTPVVTSNYGATKEFVSSKNGWLIPVRETGMKNVAYDHSGNPPFGKPDVNALASRLREIYRHPETLTSKKEGARETAQEWTWEKSAQKLCQVIREL